jgi:HlyD family secretion protein
MRRLLLVVGLVGVMGVAVLVGVKVHHARKSIGSAAPQLAAVERGTVRRTVTADGTLRALTTVLVKSDAGGKVVLLAVDVGDRVKKGDLIAKIDPTDTQTAYTQALAGMQSTRAQLSQAEVQARAQPEMTRAAIAQAQAAYDAAVTDLKRLETSTQPRARAAAKAALDKANAALKASQEDLGRLTAATHPVSRTQARSALDQAMAALKQAQESLTRLKQVQHPQALTDAQTALDTTKSNLSVAEKELRRSQKLRADGFLSQSSLESAENQHEAAKATFATAQERARTVAEDQAAEVRAAEAQVEQAQAAEVSARKAWEAIDDDQSAETRAAQARVDEAQADLSSAERTWSTIDQDQAAELAAGRAQVTQAKSALDNARAGAVQDRVRNAEVTNQQAQFTKAAAGVAQTKTALSYTTITAPRDGIILEKYVEQGTIVTSGRSSVAEGMSIVELGDLSTMYVDVEVDETDLADIHPGQKVEIEVESVTNRTFTGSVARVNPQATTTSNITTVKVEIEVLDHDERLMPGLSATCDFLAGERRDVLTLPTQGVRQREGKSYVLVPGDPNPIAVPVEVGLEGDDAVEIVSGLNQGDRVLLKQIGSASPGGPPGGPPGPPGGASDFLKRSP